MPRVIFSPNGFQKSGLHPVILDWDPTHPENMLKTANILLASQRLTAWDHGADAHVGKEPMYYGAALIRTKSNHFYTAANIHLQKPPTSRSCAEANSITEAAQRAGVPHMEVEEVWFMGGMGDPSNPARIFPEEQGKRYTPCGSCLDVILNSNKSKPGGPIVHMLPLNDGSMELVPDLADPPVGDDSYLKDNPNMVMTRTTAQLFPHQYSKWEDPNGDIKDGLRQLHQEISETPKGDPEKPFSARDAAIARAKNGIAVYELNEMAANGKSPDEIQAKINEIMMNTVKLAYGNGRRELSKVSVAIVRTEDGQFFMGNYNEGKKVPGMPTAVYNALQNSGGLDTITDIFVVTVDKEELRSFLGHADGNPAADVILPNPDGDTRDRMRKFGPKNGKSFTNLAGETVDTSTGPSVHIIAPNNGHDFNKDLHVQTYSCAKLYPNWFDAPKGNVHDGCDHGHAAASAAR